MSETGQKSALPGGTKGLVSVAGTQEVHAIHESI